MYRSSASPPDLPPASLAYPVAVARGRGPATATLQFVTLPFGAAIASAFFLGPTAGLVGLAASTALGAWWWKYGGKGTIVFEVAGGRVRVGHAGKKAPLYEGALRDLLDVTLDTKQVEMVQEGGSAIPAVRVLESRVGPKLDRARLELVLRDAPSVLLTKEYGVHMEASEWAGKIRSFLRKQGWLPLDEREDEAPPSSEMPPSG